MYVLNNKTWKEKALPDPWAALWKQCESPCMSLLEILGNQETLKSPPPHSRSLKYQVSHVVSRCATAMQALLFHSQSREQTQHLLKDPRIFANGKKHSVLLWLPNLLGLSSYLILWVTLSFPLRTFLFPLDLVKFLTQEAQLSTCRLLINLLHYINYI